MLQDRTTVKRKILLGVSAFAIGIALSGFVSVDPSADYAGAAFASGEGDEGSHGGGGNQGGGGQGGGGGHDGGHDDGGHDDGGHDDGGHEPGAGRPTTAGGGGHDEADDPVSHDDGEESDGRGPRNGQPSGDTGGKPAWAQEGIPEVELGRLNVARSPDHVLDLAYDEALANFTPEMAEFYSLTLAEAIAALSDPAVFETLTIVDSPLQNLALLKDALDGTSVLNTLPGVSNDNSTLLALFLGIASDKTVSISEDTVIAVTKILGFDLTAAEVTQLAAEAEAVRVAILAGHG